MARAGKGAKHVFAVTPPLLEDVQRGRLLSIHQRCFASVECPIRGLNPLPYTKPITSLIAHPKPCCLFDIDDATWSARPSVADHDEPDKTLRKQSSGEIMLRIA